MKWLRVVMYVFFLGGCLAMGVAARWTSDIVGSFSEPGRGFAEVWKGISNPRGMFPGQDKIVILLVGQDYNRDKRGIAYTKGSRADTIMMLLVDLERRRVQACSVPRDTYVGAPDGIYGKINATFARGGPELLVATLEERFGVDIHHHVVIKPHAVREIVDAVGGVTVEAIDAMNYDDNWGGLHVHLPAGRQHLNGEQAEGFVRFREVNRTRMNERGYIVPIRGVKGSKEEGDVRRTARQQQMVAALMASANAPTNLIRADKIISTGFNQVDTSLSRTQCLALATIFRGARMDGMVSATVPGEPATRGGVSYFILDDDRAQATVDWLVKGDEMAAKRMLRVGVWNGTKTVGVARVTAQTLEGMGFDARSEGNSPNALETTITYRKASQMSFVREIQSALGSAKLVKSTKTDADRGPDIEVVIGEDLAKTIQVP